jgi:hypothetical protein
MRSFRLDPDSVTDFLRSWPVLLLGGLIAAMVVFLGSAYWWTRILLPVLMGVCVGPRLFVGRIREQYPNARHVWLLSIGMMTALVGVVARMAFPAWQGSKFDLTWLGVTFFTILAFVLLNRGDHDVVH